MRAHRIGRRFRKRVRRIAEKARHLLRRIRRSEKARSAASESSSPGSLLDCGPVAVVSQDPPIFLTGIAYDEWLGIAGAFGRRFGDRPAGFLIYPTWSIEEPGKSAAIGAAAREHRRRYPAHRLVFMGNTQQEADLLVAEGLTSVFLNRNFTVSEEIFRPLPGGEPEFDAIYNARFVPEKRYELASSIDKLAYFGYLVGDEEECRQQVAFMQRLVRGNPGHELLSPIVDGRPVRVSPAKVNRQLNRAKIGLCLSDVEGANYASMEYMLAGLGVVSTASKGGREAYFDPEFCIVCEPKADAVKKAVAELKARNIPRDYIRRKTLLKVEAGRRRFLDLVDELRVELGGASQRAERWPFGKISGMVKWDGFEKHLQEFERAKSVAELRAQSAALADILDASDPAVQLQPTELLPIVRTIKAVSGCRLLVFGCGRDSPFWELANADGETAFLESDSDWIAAARRRLTRSMIVPVRYWTRVAEWPAQLDAGDDLLLALPDAIRTERWNVIVVDGPSGHRDDLPGRAQSIVTARRLIAPGGKIFVHDCDRPLESEFCARYLGEERRFVSVSGRATLNGYAF